MDEKYMDDEKWMKLALALAESTLGQTSPNPAVGAVVVREGQVLGLGAHLKAGEAHAEVHALYMAGERAREATLYVTLEPCDHFGKTPPCTEKIIASGVARVVVGTVDPSPWVQGRGIRRLQEAGIEVQAGVLSEQAQAVNRFFFKYVRSKLPYVTVKTAATLDGKIATAGGDSRWVTGQEARHEVHRLRRQYDAVMVGIGTVLQDDPQLTVRLLEGGRNPLRVVADSTLRIPLDAHLVQDGQARTLVLTTGNSPVEKRNALVQRGVEVAILPPASKGVDLRAAMAELARREVLSVLVEGGAELNFSLLQARLVDEIIAFIAPKLIGGRDAPTPYGGEGFRKMREALLLQGVEVRQVGEDICMTGRPQYPATNVQENFRS